MDSRGEGGKRMMEMEKKEEIEKKKKGGGGRRGDGETPAGWISFGTNSSTVFAS